MSAPLNKVGKYRVLGMIARGGMGSIYRAIHPTLNKEIILKRLTLVGNRTVNERFKREAQVMIDFREEHIVQVYDHFKEGASYYIAMEFVDGLSLAELIEKKRYLPNRISLLILHEIAKGLHYAHIKKVIHRDIKPENVLISHKGKVKLTDFGIATSKNGDEEDLTRDMTLGTPAFMSPEQIRNSSKVDERSDIYSLGVLLYKISTGRLPFPGNMNPETITMISKGLYRSPRQINPKILPIIQTIIKRSMHKNPKNRFSSVRELLDVIKLEIGGNISNEQIETEIREYVQNNRILNPKKSNYISEFFEGASKKKKYLYQWKYKIALAIILFLLIALSWFNYEKIYEIFPNDRIGIIKFHLEETAKVDTEENYTKKDNINILIFKRIDKKLQFFKQEKLTLIGKNISSNRKDKRLFASKKVYLNAGDFVAQFERKGVGNIKEFFVKPFRIHSSLTSSSNPQIIQLNTSLSKKNTVNAFFAIFDTLSNQNISTQSKIEIYQNSKWQEFLQGNELYASRKYIFRIKSSYHKIRYYSLDTRNYNQEVNVNLNLDPIPAKIIFRSNVEGMRLTLNNRKYYLNLKKKKYLNVSMDENKKRELYIKPGRYYITAEYNDKKYILTQRLNPGSIIILKLFYNKNKNQIVKI